MRISVDVSGLSKAQDWGKFSGGGELTPYRNKVTGQDDPAIRMDSGGFAHLSTLRRYGMVVRDEQGNKL